MRWSALWSKSCSLRSRLGSLAGSGRPSTRKVRDSVAAAKMLGARADCLLPTDCSRRLVAEVQGALDSCAERQRQLERSLRVSRRLLQVWEPARTPAPEPETKEEAPTPACTTSAQDLKELELLTQALEKAVRVRKGMSKAGQRDRTPSLTSASNAATSGATAPAHSQAPSRAGSRASGARSTSGIQRATVPAKDYPECRLLSRGDRAHVRTGTQATRSGPGLRDQQMAPSAVPPATELFTLKEKGTLLQLPVAFRKAASQNSRLWAQLSSIEGSDSADATRAAKTQFLHKLQVASGWSSHRPGAAEVEAHARSLRKACTLLRLHMQRELSTAPTDWMQEYRCLLVLEGLRTMVGQCLHRIQALQAAATEGLPELSLVEKPTQASPLCGGETDSSWSPELLLYSDTQELQTLATLKLRVAMLDQQIHLEKVLMAELLPLINTQEPRGPPWLALCRAAYSLLCEGGEHFLTVLRDDPAD
ncbi:tubulin epsilon and delta complex protein 2 isoform X2 [Peromyscus californicus insignis]|uniref:tubulin epsilon and delta complex protein 2 isoform X2 n=1 Tax=Peromyscus californicus insignis TaxID=564181 RepID=UPI0022A6E707|nr:tubulin epsilon and delta complex protein 2 isoform X2 [Peromyscus californicus insignis]